MAFAAGACAAVSTRDLPTLRLVVDSVQATVHDAGGRTLGATPFEVRVSAREVQRFVLTAPGHDTMRISVAHDAGADALVFDTEHPSAWGVAFSAGATWTAEPSTIVVPMARRADADPAADSLPHAVTALAFSGFADVAEREGCEPLLVDAWRDAARLFAASAGPAQSVPDSVRRMVAEEARRVAPEVRELCARPSEHLARLRQLRERLERPAAPDTAASLFAPVYFGPGSLVVTEDSVRARLHALAGELAAEEMPVTLVVEGFADSRGSESRNRELGFQRALAVIGELRRGGLPPDCCVAVSHGADPGRQTVPGASGSMPGARLNRRVTFSLDYRTP